MKVIYKHSPRNWFFILGFFATAMGVVAQIQDETADDSLIRIFTIIGFIGMASLLIGITQFGKIIIYDEYIQYKNIKIRNSEVKKISYNITMHKTNLPYTDYVFKIETNYGQEYSFSTGNLGCRKSKKMNALISYFRENFTLEYFNRFDPRFQM